VARRAGERGFLVLDGRPRHSGGRIPFYALVDASTTISPGWTSAGLRPTATCLVRSSRRSGTVLSALTRREQQVASLVSQGLTNRRIAQRLHVTDKTIEMHLSNIFAKLGVSSRTETAAAVIRGRLPAY
jgi:DNA-binding NarL/FixJ family response regulator